MYVFKGFGRNTVEGLQAATKLISQGIKIRIANMPGLQPENPDGFFMFLLQMGLAQREVDMLAQRTSGGMEAKMRAGGWPAKAPEGYVNKEKRVSSNKYERWVELDPVSGQALKKSWELLLPDCYTLDQICDELTKLGFTRSNGHPWAWNHPKTGQRLRSSNRLHHIFHNPFYAGWVVSKRFGIKIGEVRGQWKPIVTTEQFERGEQILSKHDNNKSRQKERPYLLRNLVWVKVGNTTLKLYGSTPTGKSKSYSYYITHTKIKDKKFRIPTDSVDNKIPTWLQRINVDAQKIPAIREMYHAQINTMTQGNKSEKINQLKSKLIALKEEEARLGRLLITGKMSEDTYDQLRVEWNEKVLNLNRQIKDLEFDASRQLDDLEVALALISNISILYNRLEESLKTQLLQAIVKRIIINEEGEIISYELHSPFAYLITLATSKSGEGCSSEQVRLGVPNLIRLKTFQI